MWPRVRHQFCQESPNSLQPALPVLLRRLLQAALPLSAGAVLSFPAQAHAQDAPPQQAPAPIVRVRPRPQTSVPVTAPADAAPLVARPARPRPINPQAFGAAVPPSSQPRAGANSPPQASAPKMPRPAVTPATAPSQQPADTAEHAAQPRPSAAPAFNRSLVVLDPAHGAQDSGSRIGDNLLEKDITLAFAFRLRSLLAARGLTVVLTRESDAATQSGSANTPLTLDDRAGIANHARAGACLLLHATGRGTGVHLYTSELDPAPAELTPTPWLTAQAAWVAASRQLEHSVSSALGRSHIAIVSSSASVRPVDSLTCPALVLELAPETADPHSISDAGYQERVAAAVAGALIFWQNQVQPPSRVAAAPSVKHTPTHHHVPVPTSTPQEPQP